MLQEHTVVDIVSETARVKKKLKSVLDKVTCKMVACEDKVNEIREELRRETDNAINSLNTVQSRILSEVRNYQALLMEIIRIPATCIQ